MRDGLIESVRLALSLLTIIGAVFCILLVDSCAMGGYVSNLPSTKGVPRIKVLLKEMEGNSSVTVVSKSPLKIFLGEDSNGWKRTESGQHITIKRTGETALVNGEETNRWPVKIVPEKQLPIRTANRRYLGEFWVHRGSNDGLKVVNHVHLNIYLSSVLGAEMSLDWHLEALKAQAVAARTYALWEKKRNSHQNYDVLNTTASQVYRGVGEQGKRSVEAVKATRGIVLFFNSRILPAFFHSTCGGKTTSASIGIPDFDPPDPPPLQGGVICKWDRHSKYYQWSTELSPAELQTKLDVQNESRPERIDIPQKDKSGRAQKVTIHFKNGDSTTLPARNLRSSIGYSRLRSTLFTVHKTNGGNFRFAGKGWGHGAGLCQTGAVGLAREGHTFYDILSTYYPGSTAHTHY